MWARSCPVMPPRCVTARRAPLQSHLAARCQPRREHLTIANGHAIDALRFAAGNFARVVCMVTTQRSSMVRDRHAAAGGGHLAGQCAGQRTARERRGGVGPCRGRPWAGRASWMEIYGREGTLVTTGNVSSQRGEMLRLQGARGSHELSELAIPERFVHVPADFERPSIAGRCMPCSPRRSDRAEPPADVRHRG